jgi:hypothetical protein
LLMKRVSIFLVLVVATCFGCGEPEASVQGTVTIDGQLAKQGTVVFHPVEEGWPTAYGSINEDGSYALRVGQGDLSDPDSGDVPPGEYIVTVVSTMPSQADEAEGKSAPPTPGARLSAEKYGSKETSDLRHTVKKGRNVVPLEVEGASADEVSDEDVEGATEMTDDVKADEAANKTAPPADEDTPEEPPSDEEQTAPEKPAGTSSPDAESDPPAAANDTKASGAEETP